MIAGRACNNMSGCPFALWTSDNHFPSFTPRLQDVHAWGEGCQVKHPIVGLQVGSRAFEVIYGHFAGGFDMQQACGGIGVETEGLGVGGVDGQKVVGVVRGIRILRILRVFRVVWVVGLGEQPRVAVGKDYAVGYVLQVFGLVVVKAGMVAAGGYIPFIEGLEDGAGCEIGACQTGVYVAQGVVQHEVVVGGIVCAEALAHGCYALAGEPGEAQDAVEDALLRGEVVVVVAVAGARGHAVAYLVEAHQGVGVHLLQCGDKPAHHPCHRVKGYRGAHGLAGAGLQHHLVPPLGLYKCQHLARLEHLREAGAAHGIGLDADVMAFVVGYALEECGHVVVIGEAVADEEHALLCHGRRRGSGNQQQHRNGQPAGRQGRQTAAYCKQLFHSSSVPSARMPVCGRNPPH